MSGAWVTGDTAWAIAGACVFSSFALTSHQIYKHLRHYSVPQQQVWIVRILFMVPIYSFASWLSLRFYHISIYFDTVRNCYEAFVIYNFLSLCFEYIGGESVILMAIKGRAHTPSCWTCTCCMKEFTYSLGFLRFCKQGTLQFCVVKPIMAAAIIIMVATDSYHDGDIKADTGYLWVTIVYNLSISLALLALVLFYTATKHLLMPHKPVLKFVIVKSVIFLSFWQSVALAIAEAFGMISDTADGSVRAGELSVAYQNFLICIEMLFAAILHLYAFPWIIYKVNDGMTVKLTGPGSISSNLKSTLNPQDMIDDTIRNFSSTYSKYVNHKGEHDGWEEDEEDEEDVEPAEDINLGSSSKKPPPKRVSGSRLEKFDEYEDSLA